MFRNYLTAALRNLVRNKLYAAINIVGLAVGFAAALLIALFVRDELTFDRYFPDVEHIYLLGLKDQFPGRPPSDSDINSAEYAANLLLDFPFIQKVSRISPGGRYYIRVGDVENTEQIIWADPNIFEILQIKPIVGDMAHALTNPDSIVVTRSFARKYFGEDDYIGKTVEVRDDSNSGIFKITAVIDDLPYNIHLRGEAFVAGHAALSPLARSDRNPPPPGLFQINSITYLKLADQNAVQRVEADLPAFLRRHKQVGPQSKMELQLKPLASLHFSPGNGMKPRGSMETIVAMTVIGLLIVFAASVNFVNLITARASRRAVEVGVRKAMGADRIHLIVQFIGESLIYVVTSFVLGLIFAAIFLPSVNAFLQRTMHFSLFSDPTSAAFIIGMATLVGILAGLYPAFVLSSLRPAAVMKADGFQGYALASVRQALLILQFALLISLLIATAIVERQIHFALTEAQRLDSDEVLIVNQTCRPAFKTAVAALPGVRATTCSAYVGLNPGLQIGPAKRPDGDPLTVQRAVVDPGFFEFYGLHPIAGRFFDGRASDAKPANGSAPTVVINEATVSKFGFASPQAAIGQMLMVGNPGAGEPSEIIGVVPDFAADTIREPIQPAIYAVDPAGYSTTGPRGEIFEPGSISIRLDGTQIPETIKEIDRIWKEIVRTKPINRFFLKQSIEERYRDLERQATLFAMAAGVAIFIALLGLFGLAAFTAERRTKEIGVRKALGARRSDILGLLLWQFTKPVLWANVIAWPVAYIAMHRWLENFAYHVDLAPWIFVAASALALVIAVLTVSGHALLVSRAQPASALRYE